MVKPDLASHATAEPEADPPVANWYRDPDGEGWRYWDGGGWTDRRSSGGPPNALQWIICLFLAVMVPVIGLIVGLAYTVRGGPKAGLGQVTLAVSALVIVGIVIAIIAT